eukprot:GHRR01025331.1.p2 GENE.GHRR01025331.1~~GHRR01025331.1.p2  ORF type:complete len:125 (+),score=19.72 GHRR01025331.1:718-1092(+)
MAVSDGHYQVKQAFRLVTADSSIEQLLESVTDAAACSVPHSNDCAMVLLYHPLNQACAASAHCLHIGFMCVNQHGSAEGHMISSAALTDLAVTVVRFKLRLILFSYSVLQVMIQLWAVRSSTST